MTKALDAAPRTTDNPSYRSFLRGGGDGRGRVDEDRAGAPQQGRALASRARPPALFPEFAWGWRLVDMATASRLTVAKGRDLRALQAVAEETEEEERRRRARRHPGDRTR